MYKPELVFLKKERLAKVRRRIAAVPDLVVEVISDDSRRFDTITKKQDYERFGVQGYWLIDPEREVMTFYRLVEGRFVESVVSGDRYDCAVVPGFALDLVRVRKSFKPWGCPRCFPVFLCEPPRSLR